MQVTVTIDDAVLEKVTGLAIARGTSVNELVRDYLEDLVRSAGHDSYGEGLRRLTTEGRERSSSWKFDRESLHERR